MIGERYYGANASTVIGVIVVGISLVSMVSALVTEVPVIEVGNSLARSIVASGAGIMIGWALIASRETIGGIMAIMLVFSLLANGVGVNFKQLWRVAEGAYDGVSKVTVVMKASAQNTQVGNNTRDLYAGYVAVRPLNPLEAQQCNRGTAAWTKSLAGLRNCSVMQLHCPANDSNCIAKHSS